MVSTRVVGGGAKGLKGLVIRWNKSTPGDPSRFVLPKIEQGRPAGTFGRSADRHVIRYLLDRVSKTDRGSCDGGLRR